MKQRRRRRPGAHAVTIQRVARDADVVRRGGPRGRDRRGARRARGERGRRTRRRRVGARARRRRDRRPRGGVPRGVERLDAEHVARPAGRAPRRRSSASRSSRRSRRHGRSDSPRHRRCRSSPSTTATTEVRVTLPAASALGADGGVVSGARARRRRDAGRVTCSPRRRTPRRRARSSCRRSASRRRSSASRSSRRSRRHGRSVAGDTHVVGRAPSTRGRGGRVTLPVASADGADGGVTSGQTRSTR